jgi:hypothetical protein
VADGLRRKTYWFNKRSNLIQWEKPFAVFHEEMRLPSMQEYLEVQLGLIDSDGKGKHQMISIGKRDRKISAAMGLLDYSADPKGAVSGKKMSVIGQFVPGASGFTPGFEDEEQVQDEEDDEDTLVDYDTFAVSLKSLNLSLTNEQLKAVKGLLEGLKHPICSVDDSTGDAYVNVRDFLGYAEDMFKQLSSPQYGCMESFANDWVSINTDWCQLPTKRSKAYWYNKRTGQQQWDKPPDINGYLERRFTEADIDRTGQLKFPVFRRLLKDDPLDLNYNHIAQLQVCARVKRDSMLSLICCFASSCCFMLSRFAWLCWFATARTVLGDCVLLT